MERYTTRFASTYALSFVRRFGSRWYVVPASTRAPPYQSSSAVHALTQRQLVRATALRGCARQPVAWHGLSWDAESFLRLQLARTPCGAVARDKQLVLVHAPLRARCVRAAWSEATPESTLPL